jgi:hypothetical protein
MACCNWWHAAAIPTLRFVMAIEFVAGQMLVYLIPYVHAGNYCCLSVLLRAGEVWRGRCSRLLGVCTRLWHPQMFLDGSAARQLHKLTDDFSDACYNTASLPLHFRDELLS